MQPIRSQIVKLFTGFIAGAILISSPSYSVIAIALSDQRYAPSETGLAPHPYDIGSPTLTEIWVSPGVSGNDSNDGLTPGTPLKTLTAAWSKIPPGILTSTGYRINLQPGTYPCEPAEPDNCLNNFGNRTGTYAFPIIIRASGGQGTVTISGGLDILNVSYLYLIDLTLRGGTPLPTNSSGNNLLHLASVDHVLLRGLTLDGPDCPTDACNNLQEVLKVNQAQYLYVENSVIGGAWHSAVDYFVVQYGHFINNNVHTAGQWCMYLKGGTSYLRMEGNEFHDCQLGFSAGQSANFAMMHTPWLHYDAYDIKFINNILHDLPGVGLSVAGGYNILIAYNTLYRVGISTDIGYPLLDIIRGERGCNATDELPSPLPVCLAFIGLGGWGPNYLTANRPAIPNRNVFIYNNIIYNPAPSHTQYSHFNILEPLARPSGFRNMPNPIVTDENLQIRGNTIWNGDTSMPLGIEGTLACTNSNPTCNEAQLIADNAINTIEPQFVNPALGDFHPIGTWMTSVTTYLIPDFAWDITGVPAGNNNNLVLTDFENVTRATINPPGAYYHIVPVVVSSLRASSNPTNAASVNFTVTFSETVTGLDMVGPPFDDFALTTSGVSGAAVSGVSGSGSVYTVTVNTGSGDGNIRLDVLDGNSIIDTDSNPLYDAFTSGQTYTIDKTAPTISSITRAGPNPTAGVNVDFIVTFNESVTGVDIGDFSLNTTGVTGASVVSVNGNNATRIITVNTGTGYNGTIRLDIPVSATITDLAGNLLGNLPFTGGEEYIIARLELLTPLDGATPHYNRPTFDWADFSSATGYQVQVSKNNTFTLLVVNTDTSASNSTYTPTSNLPANTLLYWRVRAKLGAAHSAWSSVWTLHTGSPPSVPSLLAPADNALTRDLTPLLDWGKSSGATFDHYQIQLADNPDFTGAVDEDIAGASNHAYTPTVDLDTNTKYYWHVRSWNTAGDYSAWAAVRTFREAMLPPGLVAPTGGITVGDRKPVFDWDDVVGATKYNLQVSLNSSFTSLVLNLNVTPSTYTPLVNLAANKLFYWRVKALGPNGPSAWSAVETFHTP